MENAQKLEEIVTSRRTEEVTDIIERMPNGFAKIITMVVCFIVGLLLLFGFIVKYPDIVVGDATISAEQAPVQLVNEQNGVLRINRIKSQDSVYPGNLLAWIDNPAHPEIIAKIKGLIANISSPTSDVRTIYNQLPKKLNLGDLTIPYASFLSSTKQLADYQDHHMYERQEKSLSNILVEQEFALKTLKEKEGLSYQNLKLSDKFLERDSILLARKVMSQAEFERSVASRIYAEDQVKSSLRNTAGVREQITNTEHTIEQNRIAKSEKELQLNLEVLTSFNNLVDKINLWEKQYLIKTPISGKVQFLKFWNDNQFVRAGEPIFSIVPSENKVFGKVILPVRGSGKVKRGQEVIIRLADFPYMEYGYIKGIVYNIALVSSPIQMGDGKMVDSYLVTVTFPKGMTTNYGTALDFKSESRGTAEIITKDRRLIERFFDNMKYIGNSK